MHPIVFADKVPRNEAHYDCDGLVAGPDPGTRRPPPPPSRGEGGGGGGEGILAGLRDKQT